MTCSMNGSLLAKRSNVASWPCSASGERSESATAESWGAAAAGASPVAGTWPAGVPAGAAGVVVAGAVAAGDGNACGPWSIFSVFGP